MTLVLDAQAAVAVATGHLPCVAVLDPIPSVPAGEPAQVAAGDDPVADTGAVAVRQGDAVGFHAPGLHSLGSRPSVERPDVLDRHRDQNGCPSSSDVGRPGVVGRLEHRVAAALADPAVLGVEREPGRVALPEQERGATLVLVGEAVQLIEVSSADLGLEQPQGPAGVDAGQLGGVADEANGRTCSPGQRHDLRELERARHTGLVDEDDVASRELGTTRAGRGARSRGGTCAGSPRAARARTRALPQHARSTRAGPGVSHRRRGRRRTHAWQLSCRHQQGRSRGSAASGGSRSS